APDVSGWPRASGHQGVAGFIGSIGFIGFMGSIVVLAGMVNRFVHCDRERAFLPIPTKSIIPDRGCKSCCKMNAFRTYVLRRRTWRKSSIQPHVAEFDTFATRAYWLTSMRSPVHAQRGIRQPPVNHSENSIRILN